MATDCFVADIVAPIKNALVGGPFGSDLVSKDYVESGVPVIRGTNMGYGRWVGGDFAYVTEEKAASLTANCAKPGDIVFTQRGTLGQVALVPSKGATRYLISQSQMKLTVDENKADPLFLYYVFTSAEQQEYIRLNAIQTGVPHTNLGILRKTPLQLPPLHEQKAIARILGTLDDKIELNRRMNATLEAMARALFQSWFVDAVPDDGSLPEGWEMSTIGAETRIVGGSTPSTKSPEFWENGEFHWVTPRDFSSLQSKVLIGSSRKVTQAGLDQITSGLLPENTILLSSRAPVGYLALTKIRTAINQGFIAMVCRGRLSPEYVMLWADSVMDKIKQAASGTTFAEISKATFRPFPIIVPLPDRLNQFTDFVRLLFECVAANERQTISLAETRDALLPKLLSGELRTEEVAYAG